LTKPSRLDGVDATPEQDPFHGPLLSDLARQKIRWHAIDRVSVLCLREPQNRVIRRNDQITCTQQPDRSAHGQPLNARHHRLGQADNDAQHRVPARNAIREPAQPLVLARRISHILRIELPTRLEVLALCAE
jgi:hypothetical protein